MTTKEEDNLRINMRLDGDARKELDLIEKSLGFRTDTAAVFFAIRHIAKHIEKGDFGEIYKTE